MWVKAIIRFRDMEAERIRSPGETFEVSLERYSRLKRLGLAVKAARPGKPVKEREETAE